MICDLTGKSQSSQEDCELLVAAAGYEAQSREAEKGRKERWKEETAGELIDKPTEPKQEIC